MLRTLSFSITLLVCSASLAQTHTSEAENARLSSLTRHDRQLLEPHLQKGPIALVEFASDTELPAIIFAARVHASAPTIMRLLSDPRGYPRFMPALDSVRVRSRRGTTLAYDWTWRTALFTLHGNNVLTAYPAPTSRRDRPYRVESRSTGGDMGNGRLMWRVYPEGPDQSLLILSSRMDLRNANYLTRQVGSHRSINRTVNIALAAVMVMGTKSEAERASGTRGVQDDSEQPLHQPEVDLRALAPMLLRGDLLLLETAGDALRQLAVIGRLGKPVERVREVMTDPREFGPAMIPGSYARVTREEGSTVDFDWGIDIPLIGTSGSMRLVDTGSVVEVDATDGAMNGGRWRFLAEQYPWGEAAVVAWADFDLTDASWLVRMLVDGDTYFGHGLSAGTQIMMLRAIRSRAWRRQEQRAAGAEPSAP